ncbi:MAG: hypothetical protein QXL47_02490 [Candidatus Anstonellales archaeon]
MEVTVELTVAGMKQRHKFKTIKETTPFGTYELINIPLTVSKLELLRIANEKGMPVFNNGEKYFPKGKTARDIIMENKEKGKKKK